MSDSRATGPARLRHRGDEPHLLREIVRTHQALVSGFARGTGMPASRFALLRLIATTDEAVGVMELSRQLGVNAAAVTRLVQELEGEGLARRRADLRDRRRSHVILTPKGRRRFTAMHDRSHELERALAMVLGAREMAAAAAVLVKLRAFVAGLRGDRKGVEP